MKFSASARWQSGAIAAPALNRPSPQFLRDVQYGLAQPQKSIPPKYFYDARGSELFEAICATAEYYPTRTEMQIMREHIDGIVAKIGKDVALLELGSGASVKTRSLIEHLRPEVYVPIDVSPSALEKACEELAQRFPYLSIEAQVGDFTELRLPVVAGMRRVVYFPGSTIGNFHPAEAFRFLTKLREQLSEGDLLLIGVDLKKDAAILNAAYNDAQGVTAAFNLNLLERINTELEGDFDLHAFRHLAFYNAAHGWMEMHLRSLCAQHVHVAGKRFQFRAEETIHTEISCKYGLKEFQDLAYGAGFRPEQAWTDKALLFSVHLMRAG